MQSLRELYKTGRGPSSSHTMGPERAANLMKSRYKDADKFVVTLYGSLASTGKGHNPMTYSKRRLRPRSARWGATLKSAAPCTRTQVALGRVERGVA